MIIFNGILTKKGNCNIVDLSQDKKQKKNGRPVQFYVPVPLKKVLDMKIDGAKVINNDDYREFILVNSRSALLRNTLEAAVVIILDKKDQYDLIPNYLKNKIEFLKKFKFLTYNEIFSNFSPIFSKGEE
ncbi:MAG: hypothetical protein EAX96_06605 [Candidatus Lokiarchaeota archaeon]|nr:hypothetical protein [Candidatus Lokiarchaeota archaeon]